MEPQKRSASPLLLKVLIVPFGILGIVKTAKTTIKLIQGIWPPDYWAWFETIMGPIWLLLALAFYLRLKQQHDQPKL